MDSEFPKWMSPGPAVCFPNQSEEASQSETKEEEKDERERCKQTPILDSEGGVEEFLVLLERIEETKKHFKRKRMNFGISSISGGGSVVEVEEDQMLMAMPGKPQAQASSGAIDVSAYNKRGTSPWKPSFEWEDFNICNSRSAQTDLSGAAATEKNKEAEESVRKRLRPFKTRSFLDGVTPTECSQGHVDDVNKEEEDVDPRPDQLELQLFPL